ncbi:MAG: NAD-binding protein [Acidimicrobiia bacterium]
MKAIVVGAGGTTRELLRRLGDRWDVVVVDMDGESLESVGLIREVIPLRGDGSSGLVLRRAGLEEADALVAATPDDDLNLEAVRIARELGVMRVVATAADPDRVAEYRALDVPVFASDSLTARQVEVLLEPRRVASTTFAQGKAEAIEFHISPDSPVRGKRLRQLHSETWVVAAVLRDGDLIIPKGPTSLEAGDRVTVVGAASDFATIVQTFTGGESRFPLNFGRKAAVVLESDDDVERTVAEAISIVRNSRAEALSVVHRDPAAERDEEKARAINQLLAAIEARSDGVEIESRPVTGDLRVALLDLARSESIGLVALPAPEGRRLWGRRRASRLVSAYGELEIPLLLCRAQHPYASIVVPARRTEAGEPAGRAAIDLAKTSGASLVGVSAVPPAFVGSAGAVDEARRAAAWLREEAAVQGVTVTRRLRRGNPVRILEEFASTAGLLVLALPDLPVRPLFPGITGHLLPRVRSSVLLVPTSR